MIYDISLTVSEELPFWPGEMGVTIVPIKRFETDGCNVSFITMGMHVGTHIDAPIHFVKNGEDAETVSLDKFMGKAKVFDLDVETSVKYDDIKSFNIEEGDMVLFNIKKNNSLILEKEFRTDYVYVTAGAAQYMADKKVKAVGVNYFSVAQCTPSADPTSHHILLENGIVIIEGLKLEGVPSGQYTMYCLPVKIRGGNGSPARAILIS